MGASNVRSRQDKLIPEQQSALARRAQDQLDALRELRMEEAWHGVGRSVGGPSFYMRPLP
ncbi:hypothetical protein ACIRL0_36145 [Streptomyces sp. NPDC102365]|uniref:hypothetical protein n=1 Tax=Streptomyces sp. NPDC102365 TaxID=3366162 RepID=UPI0038015CDC